MQAMFQVTEQLWVFEEEQCSTELISFLYVWNILMKNRMNNTQDAG